MFFKIRMWIYKLNCYGLLRLNTENNNFTFTIKAGILAKSTGSLIKKLIGPMRFWNETK